MYNRLPSHARVFREFLVCFLCFITTGPEGQEHDACWIPGHVPSHVHPCTWFMVVLHFLLHNSVDLSTWTCSLERTLVLRECRPQACWLHKADIFRTMRMISRDQRREKSNRIKTNKIKRMWWERKKYYSCVRAAVIYQCGDFISLAWWEGIKWGGKWKKKERRKKKTGVCTLIIWSLKRKRKPGNVAVAISSTFPPWVSEMQSASVGTRSSHAVPSV